jgi:SAM-dependent methyltransferase
MEIIEFKDRIYPAFQSKGFASKFAFPFAHEVCSGLGLDIGCNRLEWCLPGALPVDPVINEFHAYNLPEDQWDYIFSSHCLEHLPHWVNALDYWTSKIKSGGTLFLYLPHHSQKYWNPWHNRKHVHIFYPENIYAYLRDSGKYTKIFVSGVDLNNSFMAMAEKI